MCGGSRCDAGTSTEMVHVGISSLIGDGRLSNPKGPSTNVGNTYPNHKGSYYYRNHTLYHIRTLGPLGKVRSKGLANNRKALKHQLHHSEHLLGG